MLDPFGVDIRHFVADSRRLGVVLRQVSKQNQVAGFRLVEDLGQRSVLGNDKGDCARDPVAGCQGLRLEVRDRWFAAPVDRA